MLEIGEVEQDGVVGQQQLGNDSVTRSCDVAGGAPTVEERRELLMNLRRQDKGEILHRRAAQPLIVSVKGLERNAQRLPWKYQREQGKHVRQALVAALGHQLFDPRLGPSRPGDPVADGFPRPGG